MFVMALLILMPIFVELDNAGADAPAPPPPPPGIRPPADPKGPPTLKFF